MALPRIAVLDDYQGLSQQMADWAPLAGRAEIVVFRDTLADVDELTKRLDGFSIVCAMRERTKFGRTLLERLPGLELIASTGKHNAAIDMAAASDLGIAVAYTEPVSGGGTPELTWALILAALRNIPGEVASVRDGGWQVGLGRELAGHTLGILGLGRIGSAVARVGIAFGMRVIAWSPNLDAARAASLGVEAVMKEELFSRSDVLSVHMVLGERSRGLVAHDDLGRMKSTAWLVNTSRGPIVDEAALVDVLTERRIGGAALDVYGTEPLPADHPFRHLGNVVATPHIGYVTEQTYRAFYGQTVENIIAWLDGTPTRTLLLQGVFRGSGGR